MARNYKLVLGLHLMEVYTIRIFPNKIKPYNPSPNLIVGEMKGINLKSESKDSCSHS